MFIEFLLILVVFLSTYIQITLYKSYLKLNSKLIKLIELKTDKITFCDYDEYEYDEDTSDNSEGSHISIGSSDIELD